MGNGDRPRMINANGPLAVFWTGGGIIGGTELYLQFRYHPHATGGIQISGTGEKNLSNTDFAGSAIPQYRRSPVTRFCGNITASGSGNGIFPQNVQPAYIQCYRRPAAHLQCPDHQRRYDDCEVAAGIHSPSAHLFRQSAGTVNVNTGTLKAASKRHIQQAFSVNSARHFNSLELPGVPLLRSPANGNCHLRCGRFQRTGCGYLQRREHDRAGWRGSYHQYRNRHLFFVRTAGSTGSGTINVQRTDDLSPLQWDWTVHQRQRRVFPLVTVSCFCRPP